MDIKRELNYKLFSQHEEHSSHLQYEKEFGFYNAIAAGDIEDVKRRHAMYLETKAYSTSTDKNGILSQNPVQNRKYHFAILSAMIARFCVEAGLDREIAYSMSDIYIQKMDVCTSIPQIDELQTTMIMDFTTRMHENRKKNIYSKPIARCIDYIHNNLHKKLQVTDLAEYLSMTPAYLSRLFSKEVGVPISAYIKSERLEAASNMLRYSDYSISDLAEYFGFSSQSHFTSAFQAQYGITPKKYRDHHANKSMPGVNISAPITNENP